MVATGNFNDAWLYLTAPIVGAIVAAILHTGLTRLAQERIAASGPDRAAQTPAE
jgi:aquaporin Z